MAIKYKLLARKNPQDRTLPAKFYAQVVPTGKDGIEELADEIAMTTTMGRGDILGVLANLGEVSERRLAMGRTVDLPGIGIISSTVSSEGVDTEEEFNVAAHIRKIGVKIRPKKNLIKAAQEAGLQRY